MCRVIAYLHSQSKKLACDQFMRAATVLALLLTSGHAVSAEQFIDVQHDSVRGVTCWILNGTGISCLPDSSLLQEHTSTSADEDHTARASQATSMCQNEHLTTTPPLQERGLQL